MFNFTKSSLGNKKIKFIFDWFKLFLPISFQEQAKIKWSHVDSCTYLRCFANSLQNSRKWKRFYWDFSRVGSQSFLSTHHTSHNIRKVGQKKGLYFFKNSCIAICTETYWKIKPWKCKIFSQICESFIFLVV